MQSRKLKALALVTCLSLFAGCSVENALAQPAAVVIDAGSAVGSSASPQPDPVQSTQYAVTMAADTGTDIVAKYGPLWGAFLVLIASVRYLLKRNDSEHWLAQGRLLSSLTAAAATASAFALWRFSGAPFEGVIATAVMGINLMFPSSVKSGAVLSAEPAAGKSQAGFVRLSASLMLAAIGLASALALLVCASGCASLRSEVKAVGNQVVTCAKADQGKAQALGLQLAMQAVTQFILTGHIDWAPLADTAESGVKAQGLEVASCAFKDTVDKIQAFLAQAGQAAGGPQPLVAAPIADGGSAALAAFQIRHSIAAIQ